MPINAQDLLSVFGIGRKKPASATKGRSGRAPASVLPPDPGRVFTSPTLSVTPYAPGGAPVPVGPPPAVAQGGLDTATWLSMALSALGGGPDRNAYVAPFEQAGRQAKAAHAASLPAIAQSYDALRAQLGQQQAATAAQGQQASANIAAEGARNQGQIDQMLAPYRNIGLGQAGVGVDAQAATQKAQLQASTGTQQQLAGNMAAQAQAAGAARLADTSLAQTATTSNANNNLMSVINALEGKKASALQQYAADAQSHGSKIAQVKLQAAERDAERNDPMKAIELELRRAELDDRKMDLDERRSLAAAGPAGPNRFAAQLNDFQTKAAESNPVAFSMLTEFVTAGGKDGTPLPTVIANIRAKADKNGKIKAATGQRIDANWLIDRAREMDELERQADEEERRREEADKRRSRR